MRKIKTPLFFKVWFAFVAVLAVGGIVAIVYLGVNLIEAGPEPGTFTFRMKRMGKGIRFHPTGKVARREAMDDLGRMFPDPTTDKEPER